MAPGGTTDVSEEFLLRCSDFEPKTLRSLSDLVVRSLHQVPDNLRKRITRQHKEQPRYRAQEPRPQRQAEVAAGRRVHCHIKRLNKPAVESVEVDRLTIELLACIRIELGQCT